MQPGSFGHSHWRLGSAANGPIFSNIMGVYRKFRQRVQFTSTLMSKPLADPRRRQGREPHSPQGPNSFIFMQFSAKKLQNNRLAHPLWELRPPQENPRSATARVSSMQNPRSVTYSSPLSTHIFTRNTSQILFLLISKVLNSFPSQKRIHSSYPVVGRTVFIGG